MKIIMLSASTIKVRLLRKDLEKLGVNYFIEKQSNTAVKELVDDVVKIINNTDRFRDFFLGSMLYVEVYDGTFGEVTIYISKSEEEKIILMYETSSIKELIKLSKQLESKKSVKKSSLYYLNKSYRIIIIFSVKPKENCFINDKLKIAYTKEHFDLLVCDNATKRLSSLIL